MEYKKVIKAILVWNRRLFPIFVIILLFIVILKSLKFNIPYRIANLDYKLEFIIVSGILVLVDYYLRKK